jgi:hypothetical protein
MIISNYAVLTMALMQHQHDHVEWHGRIDMICVSRSGGRGREGIDGFQVIEVIEINISGRWMRLMVYREKR